MNLDTLLPSLGEWLRGTGPDCDVVISTRIRLARNLTGFPFTSRASVPQKSEIVARCRQAIARADLPYRLEYHDIPSMPELDRQFLVERQLISRELATVYDGPRGVAFDARESVSIMINEEDHLRMQVLRSGFAPQDAWADINRLDDALEAHLSYAFHPQFGYLTACPTNVGTGMRASFLVHLQALNLTGEIHKAFRALQKINLVVRGLHGEGSRAFGDLYQISNHITLGKSETRILTELTEVIQLLMQYERRAREALLQARKTVDLDHRIARALHDLANAHMITADEAIEKLSVVRLGIQMRLIDEIPPTLVNQLFIQTQSAHLQKRVGRPLNGEERNHERAKLLKSRLREIGSHKS